ncbi:mavicyanin [Hevea brasiliensis]|nr:mavicyanin [Hevea brasiliensis]
MVVPHLLATYLNVLHAIGATHIVGDTDGWTLFTNSSNWVQGKEFHVGDVLEFNYEKGLHNVMQVNSTAYEGCIKDTYMGLFTGGNDSLFLSEVGRIWFICGVSDHCENGQKLTINVVP